MRFVAPPTHVGADRWPVLSSVRVTAADHPAEFVVLVDCEGTPEHPYADAAPGGDGAGAQAQPEPQDSAA
nr:hypothetical protein GCM10020063_009100 [Dactylosporangium thailandense]